MEVLFEEVVLGCGLNAKKELLVKRRSAGGGNINRIGSVGDTLVVLKTIEEVSVAGERDRGELSWRVGGQKRSGAKPL